MSRRALRRIDPQLDLSTHLLAADRLPARCDALSLCGRLGPLEVEVGSGKGLFLATAAASAPQRCWLGIELATKYARYAAARLARAGLTNARVAHADALVVFRDRVADASLAAVHVYFPDPWWKARHKKRRVMSPAFLRDVERTLLPGGSLHFWTDVAEYFDSTLELLASETRLVGPRPVPDHVPEHDLDYRTHFERRMRLHGAPVYRCEFLRPPAP
jgi:tRNA (guanine-N7-)-methyltransferase